MNDTQHAAQNAGGLPDLKGIINVRCLEVAPEHGANYQ